MARPSSTSSCASSTYTPRQPDRKVCKTDAEGDDFSLSLGVPLDPEENDALIGGEVSRITDAFTTESKREYVNSMKNNITVATTHAADVLLQLMAKFAHEKHKIKLNCMVLGNSRGHGLRPLALFNSKHASVTHYIGQRRNQVRGYTEIAKTTNNTIGREPFGMKVCEIMPRQTSSMEEDEYDIRLMNIEEEKPYDAFVFMARISDSSMSVSSKAGEAYDKWCGTSKWHLSLGTIAYVASGSHYRDDVGKLLSALRRMGERYNLPVGVVFPCLRRGPDK